MIKADDLSSVTQSHYDFSSSFIGGYGDGEMIAAPPIHGRESEKLELLEAYQRVLETQESHIVFVHGTSGQGKTSLVDTLRKPVCDAGGYFCAGKFFQDSQIQEPYSAITSAFSDLSDLVVQSPDFDEQERIRVQKALYLDIRLLSRSINLTPFFTAHSLRESANDKTWTKTTNFARFRAACKNFLLTMSSEKHPVVLFLDDLQWMDHGSSKLIEMFINDDDINNVLFVFSFRDEEVELGGALRSLQAGDNTDIQLANLNFTGVREIVASSLGSTPSDIDRLSDLALQRSGGNPFFVCLFLETIATEKFLADNGPCPSFDVEEIQRCVMTANSVADLLSQKICRLPDDVRDVLVVASLIGFGFDQNVLFKVPIITNLAMDEENNSDQILSILAHAVGAGFIEVIRGGGYQFTHDKLQSAFQGLIDEPTRENFHLMIGETFLAQMTEGSVYHAAVHLNVAPRFLHCTEHYVKLAHLNLEASRYCQSFSAFDTAAVLLRKGLELLDMIGMKWLPELLDLSLKLTGSFARMSLLVGDFDACFEATHEALLHVDTKVKKMNVLLIELECRMANNEMEASIDAAKKALSELGVRLPKKPRMRHVVLKVVKLRFLMARKTNEDILGLPVVDDVLKTAPIRLLMHIAFYSYLMDEETMGSYAALLAMDLTLKNGLSTYSAPAIAIFGIAVLRMGNVEWAYTLGKLALEVMKTSPCRDADAPTIAFVNVVLLHWKDSLPTQRDPLAEAAMAGFDRGDLIYSTYCSSHVFILDAIVGTQELGVLEESILAHFNRIRDLGQDKLLVWIRPIMQFVDNLRSSCTDWRQLCCMSGDAMDFNKHIREADSSRNIIVKAVSLLMKAQLEGMFGYHEEARVTFEELQSCGHVISSSYACNLVNWGTAAANYECFRAEGRRKYLRKARTCKKFLEQSCAVGSNASAYLRHLKLKETFIRRGTVPSTSESDKKALHLLALQMEHFSLDDSNFTPCHLFGRVFTEAGCIAEMMGCYSAAERYLEQAKTIYNEWGAVAGAAWLEEKCQALQRNQEQDTNAFGTQDLLVGGIVQFPGESDAFG